MVAEKVMFSRGTLYTFGAAVHVLESPCFGDRFEEFIVRDDRAIAWRPIKDAPVSDGERTLIELAHCLWTGYSGPRIESLLNDIDQDHFDRALEAISLRRKGVRL
jgi:hypothetical protein